MTCLLLVLALGHPHARALVGGGPDDRVVNYPIAAAAPGTKPFALDFREVKASEDEVVARGLVLTRVEIDPVGASLGTRTSPGTRETGWIKSPSTLTKWVYPALEKVVSEALFAIPRRSLLLAPSTADLSAEFSDVDGDRLRGRATIDILSRTGIAPARRAPAGVVPRHYAIDQLGFEVRWTSDKAPRGPRRRAVAVIDSRKVAIVTGKMTSEIDLRPGETTRAALIGAIANILEEERRAPDRATAAVDVARIDPRLHVHLLDLDFNSYGTVPVASALNRELVERATAGTIGPTFAKTCARRLMNSF